MASRGRAGSTSPGPVIRVVPPGRSRSPYSRSASGASSSDDGGDDGLFVMSTISKDDTLDMASKERQMLSVLMSQFSSEGVSLRMGGTRFDVDPSFMPTPMIPLPGMLHPATSYAPRYFPPHMGPGPPPPPPPPPAMPGMPPRPGYPNTGMPPPRPQIVPEIPWSQVVTGTPWRTRLRVDRLEGRRRRGRERIRSRPKMTFAEAICNIRIKPLRAGDLPPPGSTSSSVTSSRSQSPQSTPGGSSPLGDAEESRVRNPAGGPDADSDSSPPGKDGDRSRDPPDEGDSSKGQSGEDAGDGDKEGGKGHEESSGDSNGGKDNDENGEEKKDDEKRKDGGEKKNEKEEKNEREKNEKEKNEKKKNEKEKNEKEKNEKKKNEKEKNEKEENEEEKNEYEEKEDESEDEERKKRRKGKKKASPEKQADDSAGGDENESATADEDAISVASSSSSSSSRFAKLSVASEVLENMKKDDVWENSMAVKLGLVADEHLPIDVLSKSDQTSRFIAYLLDTIQLLERQVRFAGAVPPPPAAAKRRDNIVDEDRGPPAACYRVLHRVYCTNTYHQHDRSIFEDEPAYVEFQAGHKELLRGSKQVLNLGIFFAHNPHVTFVVFKEWTCSQNPFITRRRWFSPGSLNQASERAERIRISSPVLAKALLQVAEYEPYDSEEPDQVEKEMEAPYAFLYHHREKLAVLAELAEFEQAVTTMLDFLKDYAEEYAEADEMFGRGVVKEMHLTKLFRPNQIVLNRNRTTDILEAHLLERPTKERERISLRGWSLVYNGSQLHRKRWMASFEYLPEGETKISDLQYQPVEHAPEKTVKELRERGRKFWSMRGQQLACYTGWDKNRGHYYIDARFMVDTSTYRKMHHTSSVFDFDPVEPSKYDHWPGKFDKDDNEELPEEMLLLLPPTTYGFNLQAKKWVQLSIEKFHDVNWNKMAFNRLVLNPKTKELIYALVSSQTSDDRRMDDIITGKGNGLIVLLHGSPGTGKTLTAESVAEIAEKPLYRVTCGDIGTEAAEVEKYLETVLYLGKIWDCVLLLDEADVFLEERTIADLQRNSLVSVFLRILEYYEGILILTSNRVGTFDEAFKSRIQLAIHYDHLSTKSRRTIWRNFFDMLEESEEDANMAELERRLDALADEEMNGRQIRNALLTARQLAKHRNEQLGWEHLNQVMRTSTAFNRYLMDVRGHTDEEWAREEMLR